MANEFIIKNGFISKDTSIVQGGLSATTISGATFYSGSTNLYSIFSTPDSGDITRVQPGLNIYTGGTGNNPTVNISAATLTSLSATTLSGGTIFSGSTNLYSIFSTTDTNDITRVQPGSNITTGGTGNNPVINLVSSPSINGLTFSGSAVGNSVSATTISGATFYSGSTDLYNIFSTTDTNDITRIQPGLNIYTGGTDNFPTINISAATLTSLSATTISGATIYSGSTNLYSIFSTTDANDITRVQPGLNIYTGGTDNSPTVNISAATLTSLSATTLSGGTIYSGSTNLYSIFSTVDTNDVTRVQPGSNIYTGGTDNFPTVNISAATLTSLSATTMSGGTLYSGSTNLYSIFSTTDANDITRVQPGSNINTGGTGNNPVISLISNPSLNSLILSGVSSLGTFSASTISGTTFISGSTNLYSIFSTTDTNDITRVQPGSNITTGGTGNNPTISLVSSPSINGIISSGTSQLNITTSVSISGGTISGGTIFSGTNNITNLFVQKAGDIMTGQLTTTSLSATTISGATLFSGSTNLYSIFQRPEITVNNINAGTNITTGGTAISPTINLTASPSINSLSFSGTATGIALSATTISGATFFSGSTNLYSIFSTVDTNDITRVQPGSNTYTGGTDNFPTINFSSATIDNITITGNSLSKITTQFSANTISATTIYINNYNVTNPQITNSSSTGTGLMFDSANVLSLHTAGPQRLLIDTTGGISNGAQSVPSSYNTYLSGKTVLDNLSGGTISGGTIFSGSTNLNSIFVELAGDTMTGQLTTTALSATTISGGTLFSGSTNLYSIFLESAGDTLTGQLNTAAGSTSIVPIKIATGATLTNPIAGGVEFDNSALFFTVDTTQGRTEVDNQSIYRLTVNGQATGGTIADYFSGSSASPTAFPTVTNGVYELNFYLYYLKTTAGTVTYTLTNTQTYTNIAATYVQSSSAGIGTNTSASTASIVSTTTAAAALPATLSLANGANHMAHIRAIAECGTAGNIRLRVTCSAGTLTPLRGSYYTARRLFAGNVGTFVA
jgi:PII-like signaling protein